MRAAVVLVGVGLWLMALPAFAAWQECRTDGGYHSADWPCDNAPPYTNLCLASEPCGGKQWLKGYYCANGGERTTCTTLDNGSTPVERWDSGCKRITPQVGSPNPTFDCHCDWSNRIGWYTSSETMPRGQCRTNVQ